ncbi:MAG: two pore domain potassium channel family protein [archaeon]|nr:MAG: two pore domain potassium channel family protein [archaeon]
MTYAKVILSLIIIGAILGVGTIQFHYAEGWSWTDSFYFTGMTLTTVGYGDLHPTKDSTKMFTVFYTIAAIGAFLYALTNVTEELFKKRFENMYAFFRRRANNNKKIDPQKKLHHF